MSERSEYRPGEFCWVDLATNDVDAAKAFYSELLGAETEAAPGDPEQNGHYGFLMRDGKRVAGYGDTMGPDQPPAWSSYVAVASADETAEKVKVAGGNVLMEPLDLPGDSGRMAVCRDAEGAFFSIYQSRGNTGAQIVNEVGTWTWTNLLTRDLDAAKRFYADVFGWEAVSNPDIPEGILNWKVERQRWPEGLGGLMAMPEMVPAEVPPYWEVYFKVADLDRAIQQTEGAGGQVMAGPIEIPIGRIASVTDPQGAAVSLMQADYPEPR